MSDVAVTCKFCKRSSRPTPTTTAEDAEGEAPEPLPWRRKGGLECAICPAVIKFRYTEKSKAEFLESLKDPEVFARFLDEVSDYEGKRKLGKARPFAGGAPQAAEGHLESGNFVL